MDLHVITQGDQSLIEGPAVTRLLHAPEDVVEIIGACFEQHTRAVLLYADNLTEQFFDLSSGEAGAILQKFRNYRIRLAVVASPEGTPQSRRFRELIADERQGNDFRLFPDRTAAEAWLLGG